MKTYLVGLCAITLFDFLGTVMRCLYLCMHCFCWQIFFCHHVTPVTIGHFLVLIF